VAIAETKDLREQIQAREKTAAELDARLQDILSGIPNVPHESVPAGHQRGENLEVRRGVRRQSLTSRRNRTGNSGRNSASSTWNAP